MSNKLLETIVVCSLIGVILILIFPIVERVIYQSQTSGIKASVYGSIDSVKILYINESNEKKIDLPFTIKYNKTGFVAYSKFKAMDTTNTITKNGRIPIDGEITIIKDGDVIVNNLKYENFICNKPLKGEVKCQRNS